MTNVADYILTKPNVLSAEQCAAIIQRGEDIMTHNANAAEMGNVSNQKPLARQDKSLFMPDVLGEFWHIIHDPVIAAFDEYSQHYEICKNFVLESRTCKFQKTSVGQSGLSSWHVEVMHLHGAVDRLLVWSIYLNNVDDGGETEFLDQRVKVKPVTGTLAMWPAGITHPHRGNPPYSNDKYIVTGWLNMKASAA